MSLSASPPSAEVRAAFGAQGEPSLLPGGEGRAYRAGEIVLRRETDLGESAWTAAVFDGIREGGFRMPRPLRTRSGEWLAEGGWSAWTFVAGRAALPEDAPHLLPALAAFHAAVADVPWPAFLDQRRSPYVDADRAAWGEIPQPRDPRLREPLRRLTALRRPLPAMRDQLIHGDLSPGNILIAPGLAPAIIDLAPYRRPAPFAAAVCAFWLGPWRDREDVLDAFTTVPELDQLLVRACIRMLVSMDGWGYTHELDRYDAAIEMICRRVER